MIHHNLRGVLFQVVCFHACSFFKELTISVNAAAWKESNQSKKDPQHGKQCSLLKMAEISSLSPWVINASAGTDYFCRVKFSERPLCLKQHNQYPTEVSGKGKTTKCSITVFSKLSFTWTFWRSIIGDWKLRHASSLRWLQKDPIILTFIEN